MKNRISNMFILAFFSIATLACKSDKKNEVEPTGAEEALVAGEEAVKFKIDTSASTIEWKGSKPTGEHIGTIAIQSGFLMANSEEIKGGSVTINMKSITVMDEDLSEDKKTSLENHLKGTVEGKETDFFNVPEFPTATFEITGLTEKEGQQILSGNLTIKEETKNIEFPVSTTFNGNEVVLESEPFTIDRTHWNVNYGSKSVFDNLGDSFIDDDIQLSIKVRAEKVTE
ncbi:MAG TPA: YceI family protein [Salinimicrobium sp.]|nr:YceI family protein [Salinimicrobium sp.]